MRNFARFSRKLTAQPSSALYQASQTLREHQRRTAQLDKLDLAFADQYVKGAASNPEIATGFGNTHRDRLDVGSAFLVCSLVVSA